MQTEPETVMPRPYQGYRDIDGSTKIKSFIAKVNMGKGSKTWKRSFGPEEYASRFNIHGKAYEVSTYRAKARHAQTWQIV